MSGLNSGQLCNQLENNVKSTQVLSQQIISQKKTEKNDQNPNMHNRVLSEDQTNDIFHNEVNQDIKSSNAIILKRNKEKEKKFKDEIKSLNEKIVLLESQFSYENLLYKKKLSEMKLINQSEPLLIEKQIRKEIISEKIEFINRLIKDYLSCPISFEPFIDPVIASDNQTYEKKEILKWLEHKKYSPITFKKIFTKVLRTNYLAKSLLSFLHQQVNTCMNELSKL